MQHLVPLRYAQLVEIFIGVRVELNRLIVLHRTHRAPGTNVDAHANGTLVQIGLTVGGGGGQAHHAHYRKALEHNHARVGHAFIAVALEARVKVN